MYATMSAGTISKPVTEIGTALIDDVEFVAKAMKTSLGRSVFQVFIPRYWIARRKWPVILFLHGDDERGLDGESQTRLGIRRFIAHLGADFPCIVVCPQCHPGRRWTQPEMQKIALAALDQTLHEYNGDPDRVYLTGLSLGAYGAWELARRFPHRWAVIAPVCGGIVYPESVDADAHETAAMERDPYGSVASRLRSMPVWVFHGAADSIVPVSEARQLVAALHALDADVRFTEYAGVGHESWNDAYAEPNLLKWLLSHKLPHCGSFAGSRRPLRR